MIWSLITFSFRYVLSLIILNKRYPSLSNSIHLYQAQDIFKRIKWIAHEKENRKKLKFCIITIPQRDICPRSPRRFLGVSRRVL